MVVVLTNPDRPWPNATKCTVIDGSVQHDNVPIIRKTPQATNHWEIFSINWGGNPTVILSNDPVNPNSKDPITEGQKNLNTMRIHQNIDPIDVQIIRDIGWPSGKIILPD
jgi:hypothetical protein